MQINDPLLEFVKAAKEYFSFLVQSYGFHQRNSSSNTVSYSKKNITVTVTINNVSELELDIFFNGFEESYGIADCLRLVDPEKAQAYRHFAATSKDLLNIGLSRLASDLQQYGERALHGNANFFRELQAAKRRARSELLVDAELRSARMQASDAWTRKQYRRFLDALTPFADHLTKSEVAKLTYAKKRLNSRDD